MATAAATTHCPECGAPVKSGDKQCWMCFRRLEWESTAVKIANSDQFAERPAPQSRTYYRTNPWAIAGIVLAALAMGPAACIAFFVTCLATLSNTGGGGQDWVLPASAGAAFVVFVGFCVLIGMLGTRITRPVRH